MTDSAVMGKMLSQGNTAQIFEWGEDRILKLYRPGIPDDFCTYEFMVTQYAYEQLQVTPKPMEIVHVDSRIGAVYERIDGNTMLKSMLAKPWTLDKCSKILAQCHIALQRPVNIPLTTVKEKLKREIESVSLLSANEKSSILQYLDTLPDGNALCHFDYHPDNIMIFAGQYRVIDWMTGCMGDPLSDTARTALILNYAEIPRASFIVNFIAGLFQKSIRKKYLREYASLTNASIPDIEKWELPLAAARLCEWIPDGESKKLLSLVRQKLATQAANPDF
jgi:Ser/Thr protein kinase RdoA (MazF antagonist)